MYKTVAVIDGNSLMHRAYHAVPPTMNAPDGTPTNACFGFVAMLLKFVEMAHPDAIVCAFDAGRAKWRMEAIEQYKAQRPPMDDALKVQFPLMEGLLEAMSIPVVRVAGWEGDDILGTVSARDEALGYRTLLVSGDKDVYQLVSELTHVVTTKKGITDVAIYGPDEVFERYGVTPAQFPDFLGLKGDASDNIPGVPGVGDKTAAKLLSAYATLRHLRAHRRASKASKEGEDRDQPRPGVRKPEGGDHLARCRFRARLGGRGVPLVRRRARDGRLQKRPLQCAFDPRAEPCGGEGACRASRAFVGARSARCRRACRR